MEGTRSAKREIGIRLVVMLASFLVGVVLLEIALRVIEPRETMRYFFVQPDSLVHHKFIPNAKGRYRNVEFYTEYTINTFGLRDRDFPMEKPPQTHRILVVGDSFTEGEGVEAKETFSKVLEQTLQGKSSTSNYQVINAGCGSYSPLLEYLYLKNAGMKLAPDLVVLFFDLSDVFDDIQYTRHARFDSTGIPLGVSPTPEDHGETWLGRTLISVKDFFKDHVRLYNFIRLRIGRYIEGSSHKGIELGNIQYDKYAMLRENYVPTDDRDWSLSYKYILLIRDMLKARGIDLWIVVYPYGLQVSPREFVDGRQYWGFKTDTVYSTRPQKFMEDFCGRNGIQAVNLCSDFISLSSTNYPMYYNFNGHWTARSHQLVAEILDRKLEPYLQSRFNTNEVVIQK